MKLVIMLSVAMMMSNVAAPGSGDEALWLRYPAISPDGTQIAFAYAGDLWLVPSEGGEARRLTSHVGYEKAPVWSPDGKRIAFASDRHGNFDVFLMPSGGGNATRLTHHSAQDHPTGFTPDGREVLFMSSRQDAPEAALFPSGVLSELYAVSVDGGRARQILTTPAEMARFSPDGKTLAYHDRKGYENEWRKHHTSVVARDVWTYEPATGKHTKLTDFSGEDRNPVWSPDGTSLYYLSEEGGASNVWKMPLKNPAGRAQVTRHETHPVRFLSVADGGTLVYAQGGALWTLAPGGEPRRVNVAIRSDDKMNPAAPAVLRSGATEFAVAPNEDEVAFVVRGEVFVASVEHGTTKRVTGTPVQERSLTWSKDGKSLYYASEREQAWGIYKSSLVREGEERFYSATIFKEEPVLVLAGEEVFQPLVSPDGKNLTYVRNRDAIWILDLETGKTRELVGEQYNYSYADGDIAFAWSPDGKWLTFDYLPWKRWIGEVGVANVETGEIVNMSESGYQEYVPLWSRDGRAIYFHSDRFGKRSHGGWGSEDDIMTLYLTQEALDRANLSEEDYTVLKKKEDEKKKEADKDEKDKDKKDKKKKDEEKPVEPVRVEFSGRENRVKRLTHHSAPIGGAALSPDGENLVYFAQIEKTWDLWMATPRKGETKKLAALKSDAPGSVAFSKDGESVFVMKDKGGLAKIKLADGSSKDVSYAAEMVVDSPEERAYMFEHAWRQVLRKFYDPGLHGVDWEAMKRHYAPFLPHITNNHDFAEMMSEMLGELNASHTGSGYRFGRGGEGDQTASLGLLYDTAWASDGLKVAEVIENGPCHAADSKIAPGVILSAIDGTPLVLSTDPAALLNRKAGQRVLLSLVSADGKTKWEEVAKPFSLGEEGELLYRRWIRRRAALAEKLSGGAVGYAHVPSMSDGGFRAAYNDIIGKNSDKLALIVDTRFNGGGWLHDDLAKLLNGVRSMDFAPRGKYIGSEPLFRWSRPVAVLQSESNYSDAHLFPYLFNYLRIGKLIGTPVPGTGTAVWWETLLDPTLYFGIPQVTVRDPRNDRPLENTQLAPDIYVLNDPESAAKGRDLQLEKAVEVLLEEIKNAPPAFPE